MKNQQSLSANELGTGKAQPVKASQRIVVLDALRGFALMGIALANYPEFTLWTFLSETEQAEMPSIRHSPFLWHRLWLGHQHGALAIRTHQPHRLFHRNPPLLLLATLLQLRASRMALANAYIQKKVPTGQAHTSIRKNSFRTMIRKLFLFCP